MLKMTKTSAIMYILLISKLHSSSHMITVSLNSMQFGIKNQQITETIKEFMRHTI